MRAILIDPFAITVRDIDLPGHHSDMDRLEAIYAALSHETCKVDTIDGVRLGKRDFLLVDGNGLVREQPQRWFFIWGWHHETLAGKGLIVGADHAGNERATSLPTIEVEWRTRFFQTAGMSLVATVQPWRRLQ